MAETDDIRKIIEQEKALVFQSFDEETAFALGQKLRDRAITHDLAVNIDIRLWDRPLFYAALPGSTAANANWARRKINSVQHFQKPSYRLFLETGDQVVPPRHGLNDADYVFAGGAFPDPLDASAGHWRSCRLRPAATRGSQSRRGGLV
jgi:uncharacterized protein (UPF0303 family)